MYVKMEDFICNCRFYSNIGPNQVYAKRAGWWKSHVIVKVLWCCGAKQGKRSMWKIESRTTECQGLMVLEGGNNK